MYLIPSNVIMLREGSRVMVTTDWMRSLRLLRDSLQGRYGRIVLMAPTLPAEMSSQSLDVVDGSEDIWAIPAFDDRCRARHYWLRERRPWREMVRQRLDQSRVVHSGLDDVYRPIAFDACVEALRADKPLVFVRDIDAAQQLRDMARGRGLVQNVRARAYGFAFDRCMRYGVRRAALSLMKGRLLSEKYRRLSSQVREFEDTSYTTDEIVPAPLVSRRLESLVAGRPLRLVYCGRIEWRKGVEHSIRVVGAARRLGIHVEYHVIGEGSARDLCERLARDLGVAESVRFLGKKPYGPALLRHLAEYDALLFTPPAEDTPRMIFDGYAAGLPMVATAIEYAKERADREGASVIFPLNDVDAGGRVLAELHSDRSRLCALTRKAQDAAKYHAADVWYRRRAEWTFEAVERHESVRGRA